MKNSKAKIIMHPVRIKIIQLLANGSKMNVQQIAKRIDDVSQASLYRHLNTLVDEEMIEVVEENQIRGTVERIYAIKSPNIQTQEELKSFSKEEHLSMFIMFQAFLMGQYEKYLDQENFDLVKDGVSYRVASLNLSDDEFQELTGKMASLLMEAMKNEPSEERVARQFATIIIPEK
ncbi:helix-turn-helix domain-containing protein [Falsibacillus albus]|uniref:ArsR family transcriptional regulator n=1 Tax=Falsibacillus albus TaxID=2478915 RepID=A0A3L7JQL8_9BACI|nr:helix-turn-helix domain-containing protein [Falsibacillus albus]RLQ93118.1 ArsR family transcriptional regulator [Falsibacillus albus]